MMDGWSVVWLDDVNDLGVFVASVNETEVAFFRRRDYGLYKANPTCLW